MKYALLALVCALFLAAVSTPKSNAAGDEWLVRAFQCIHRYEGAWNSNTGNGYYGGLQMNRDFMYAYGREYVRRYGYAHNWPIAVQIQVAIRAYKSGRGFAPWPNTRRMCGL